jgi:Protein of unknown function (DUF3606)
LVRELLLGGLIGAGRNPKTLIPDKETAMSDSKAKVGKPDRERINPEEEYELHDWAKHFSVNKETVKQAVQQVGPMVKDVEKALRGK